MERKFNPKHCFCYPASRFEDNVELIQNVEEVDMLDPDPRHRCLIIFRLFQILFTYLESYLKM